MRLSLFVFANLMLALGAAFVIAGDLEEWLFFFALVAWPSFLAIAFLVIKSILVVISGGGWGGCLASAFIIFDIVASTVAASCVAGPDVEVWVTVFMISLLAVPVILVGVCWQLILAFVRAATINHPGG